MGRELNNDTLERINLWVLEYGRQLSARDMCRALHEVGRVCRQVGPFFETYDVFVTPALATPPPPLGNLFADNDGEPSWHRMRAFTPFTHIYNGSGQPAMSVPVMLNGDGIPIGIQLVGRYAEDGLLISLASQLEEAQPWRADRPPVYA
jgi:amidase